MMSVLWRTTQWGESKHRHHLLRSLPSFSMLIVLVAMHGEMLVLPASPTSSALSHGGERTVVRRISATTQSRYDGILSFQTHRFEDALPRCNKPLKTMLQHQPPCAIGIFLLAFILLTFPGLFPLPFPHCPPSVEQEGDTLHALHPLTADKLMR